MTPSNTTPGGELRHPQKNPTSGYTDLEVATDSVNRGAVFKFLSNRGTTGCCSNRFAMHSGALGHWALPRDFVVAPMPDRPKSACSDGHVELQLEIGSTCLGLRIGWRVTYIKVR